MKYAIVESGGKQFRAVEGDTIEVDRLPVEPGDVLDLERVLLLVDGDAVQVGTPTLAGIAVTVTVLDHIKGPKVLSFKYRPKKRIRVRIGHRQQYTRLQVEHIGKPGDYQPAEKPAKKAKPAEPKAEKPAAKKAAAPKAVVAPPKGKPAAKPAAKKSDAKPAAKAKKPAAKTTKK